MTKIKNYFFLCVFATFSFATFGQTYKIDNVENFRSNGIKPVKTEGGIVGYTIFYKTDKADRKNDNYAFELLDEKLKKVNRIKVVLPRGTRLIQSVHNGINLGMMFYNTSGGKYIFKSYDATLKLVGSFESEKINSYERAALNHMADNESSTFYGIHAIPMKGFVRAGYGEKKDQFSVTVFDVNFKKKWVYQTPEKQDGLETFVMSDINDKYITGLTMRRKGITSLKFEYFLTVFDFETGKKLIDVSAEKQKENLSISATNLLDNDQLLVLGEYYDAEDKAGVSKSNGIYFKKFDIKTGKATNEIKLSWKVDIKKMFNQNGMKRIEENYSNFPMSLIRSANGHTYLIYEQYRRAVDGVGLAISALGGSASIAKLKIGDLWMLELDENYKPLNVNYYIKESSNVILPEGANFFGTGFLGMYAKNTGEFDYQFTQQSADKRTFNVAYVNYDREEGEKSKPIVAGIFMSDDGKINYDKVDITVPKKTYQYLYPGPGNSIMLAQYNYKEEVINLKLIKMNY
jgi:hypothetical protein